MVEKKVTSNSEDVTERKLVCGQGCILHNWRTFTHMSGIVSSDTNIDGIPLVDITEALHGSPKHQDYEKIEELRFNRRDPLYEKLLEALREGREIKKNSLN